MYIYVYVFKFVMWMCIYSYICNSQVVPLYWDQNQRVTVPSPSGAVTPGTVYSYSDVQTPVLHHVISYPPLAYLLNCVLGSLNVLRDCNIPSLSELYAEHLKVMLKDVSYAVWKIHTDLRARGLKYFSQHDSRTVEVSAPTGRVELDKVYMTLLVTEIVPYILFCFEKLHRYNVRDVNVVTIPLLSKPPDIYSHSDPTTRVWSPSSWNIIRACWDIAVQSDLLYI